jgi:translocation protein SEC63
MGNQSASDKQLKSHYRHLSKQFHPDKRLPDPAANLTIEDINDYWVEITKAHKALTDEDVRRNYLEYGHPDGKQSFSIGIALPQFIVTEGNGKYVLLVYAALLGVLLPYLVGKWWYGTQRVTRDKVLVSTAGKLFREYEDNLDEEGMIAALSIGDEFREILSGNRAEEGLSKLEQAIFSPDSSAATSKPIPEKYRVQLQEMDDTVRRKTLALLWAYLRRVELDDKTLNLGKSTDLVT